MQEVGEQESTPGKTLVQFANEAHNNLKEFRADTLARGRVERENQVKADKCVVQQRQEQATWRKLADMNAMQISDVFNHISEFPPEACAKVTSVESVAVITPHHAKTAFSVPMVKHVAIAMKSVVVASNVGGFQMEFTDGVAGW